MTSVLGVVDLTIAPKPPLIPKPPLDPMEILHGSLMVPRNKLLEQNVKGFLGVSENVV